MLDAYTTAPSFRHCTLNGLRQGQSRKDVELQAMPGHQLSFPDGGVESSDGPEESRRWAPFDANDRDETSVQLIDGARKMQRESDQAEYGLGDRPDGDYPDDRQAGGT